MSAGASNSVEIVYDPSSAGQTEIARLLVHYSPPEIATRATAVGADEALTSDGLAAGCVVLFDDTRASELRRLAANANCHFRVVVAFLDAWPANLGKFHACYALADLVLIADERLRRRLGPLPRTLALPTLDDDTYRSFGAAELRGRRVLWFLPAPSEPRPAYEPWVPSPDALLRETEFEGHAELAENATREERVEALNRAAIAVCGAAGAASNQDLIEAAACGCSIVVTHRSNRAGVVRNGVTGTVVTSDGEGMLSGLRSALSERPTLVANMHAAIRARGWRVSGAQVYRAVVGLDASEPASDRADLSRDLTVFVSTVGTPSLPACLAHLAQQDCRFRVHVIENVAPMSAAFQAMLDTCDTPYYVQVDEDMLLHPDAVRRLHASITVAPPEVALVVAYLHDVHLDAPVQGVKIFRHDIVRRYPFADVQSCELDQVDRMARDGFTYQVLARDRERGDDDATFSFRILGLHGGMHTWRSVYERFRTLELARRKNPRRFKHQEAWPGMLVDRILERQDPDDFYALMGLLAGALSPEKSPAREKDFRIYSSLPGLDDAIAFLREIKAGDAPK